jgi:hypothetical protein
VGSGCSMRSSGAQEVRISVEVVEGVEKEEEEYLDRADRVDREELVVGMEKATVVVVLAT